MSSLKIVPELRNYRRRHVPFESPIDSNWRSRSLTVSSGVGRTRVNTLYVLDEPATGLHSADEEKLNTLLRNDEASAKDAGLISSLNTNVYSSGAR